jgi:hypothetical protein
MMNKLLKITAVVIPVLVLIGTLFKTNHWPGADILLIIGSSCGILLVAYLIFFTSSKDLTGFERFNGIFAFLALLLILLTFLFKLMHWPGAAKLVWVADIGILLSGVFYLVDSFLENDASKWRLKILTAFFILLLFAAIMLAA